MKVSKVPRLSRKSSQRCRKYHACHAESRGAKSDLGCRQASADLYEGLESATPVTQIKPEVPRVPRLSRGKPRRQIRPRMSPSFRWPLWRSRKCHACHANQAWGTQSYHACHAESRGAKSDLGCRQASADLYEGLESATPVTQIEPALPKVPRLSRGKPRRQIRPRMSPSFRWPLWRSRKCHACHANQAWGTQSTTPVTQCCVVSCVVLRCVALRCVVLCCVALRALRCVRLCLLQLLLLLLLLLLLSGSGRRGEEGRSIGMCRNKKQKTPQHNVGKYIYTSNLWYFLIFIIIFHFHIDTLHAFPNLSPLNHSPACFATGPRFCSSFWQSGVSHNVGSGEHPEYRIW